MVSILFTYFILCAEEYRYVHLKSVWAYTLLHATNAVFSHY